jgi:hypothetical protein
MTFDVITCDKCGPAVNAAILVKLVEGELAFCKHHFNEYSEALDKVAYEIVELNKTEEVPQLQGAE